MSLSKDLLERKLEEIDIMEISQLLMNKLNTDRLCTMFGLSRTEREDVKGAICYKGTVHGLYTCLIIWRQPNPFQATFKAILEIFLKVRRGDIAMDIGEYMLRKSKFYNIYIYVYVILCIYNM